MNQPEQSEQPDKLFEEPAAEPVAGGPPRAALRWFRLVGLPAVALLAIVTATLLLRSHGDSAGDAVQLDQDALASGGTDVAPEEGALAPDFALMTADGQAYRLSDLRGHPVLINFWATWCGPCKSEMPAIEAVYHEHEADGLVVLAVNVREGWSQVTPYISKLGLTFPVLLDGNGSVSGRYRIRALPTTYLITRDGHVSGSRQGAYTRSMLSGRIEQLLEEP